MIALTLFERFPVVALSDDAMMAGRWYFQQTSERKRHEKMIYRERLRFRTILGLSAILLLATNAPLVQSETFTFEEVPIGPLTTPLSQGAVRADFQGGLVIERPYYCLLGGHVLESVSGHAMSVSFNQPLKSFRMSFATTDNPFGIPNSIRIETYLGPTLVSTHTQQGSHFNLGFSRSLLPEGIFSYTGPTFDRIKFTSVLAIDNLRITVDASMPEIRP